MTAMTAMDDALYGEGYFEHADGSNYTAYGDDPGWRITARIMAEHVKPRATVGEVGCAKGFYVQAAREQGLLAVGVDISRYAVSQCPPAAAPYVDLGDAAELPWRDNSLDVVCSWEMLEHVPEEWIVPVLMEMGRVLKSGGTMWHRIALEDAEEDHHHDDDVTHVLIRTESWWRRLFEEMGLRRHKEEEVQLNAAFKGRDWSGRFFVYELSKDA